MKKKWNDKFNTIVESKMKLEDAFEWRIALEENKENGIMQINVRQFQIATCEGAYEGPTKSGFVLKIKTKEDFNKFKDFFSKSLEDMEKRF